MKRSVTKLTSAPQLSKSTSSDGGLLAISSQWMSTNFPRRYKLRWEREDADTEGDLAQTRRERKDSLRFTSWREITVVEGDLVARQRKRSAPIPPAVQHSTDASICVRSLILISCNKKIEFPSEYELATNKQYWHHLLRISELIRCYTTYEYWKRPKTHLPTQEIYGPG